MCFIYLIKGSPNKLLVYIFAFIFYCLLTKIQKYIYACFSLSWFVGVEATTSSQIRVLVLIRISSRFWFKLVSMVLYMLMSIHEQKIEVQFWVKAVQLITRGKMVILVKIGQSQSWPSGLLVNHQFNHALFIFQVQFDHWIKRNGKFEIDLFLK